MRATSLRPSKAPPLASAPSSAALSLLLPLEAERQRGFFPSFRLFRRDGFASLAKLLRCCRRSRPSKEAPSTGRAPGITTFAETFCFAGASGASRGARLGRTPLVHLHKPRPGATDAQAAGDDAMMEAHARQDGAALFYYIRYALASVTSPSNIPMPVHTPCNERAAGRAEEAVHSGPVVSRGASHARARG